MRASLCRSLARLPARLAATRTPGPTSPTPPGPTSPTPGPTSPTPLTAKDVAMKYYDSYNRKDMGAVMSLIAEDCVYQDLIYQDAFVGREAVATYFDKIATLVPADIKFVVEDITDGDPRKVGVRWHVELDGVAEFPFSRGVSFYETNDAGQIVFARDIVEPTLKPGAASLGAISLLAPLVRMLGPAANPANLPRLPLAAAAMWAFWAGYVSYVLLSTAAPGLPVWRTTPEALAEVLHESLNFFYVNIALAQAGLSPVPSVAEHPVSEALFNFINAWSMMLLPAWLADPRGRRVGGKLPLWVATMMLTNVFLPIYMAKRLEPDEGSGPGPGASEAPPQLPPWAPAVGGVALAVGAFSLFWAAAARPEYGGLAERWQYAAARASGDRVFWAFCLDAGLYSVWQAWLLGDAGAPAWQRFLPFFGMAAWELQGPGGQAGKERGEAAHRP